jgi:hypothetical protein
MRAPPITVACECGELRHVPYREIWRCEACGRTWNTAQIPEEEYYGLLRDMRRLRLFPIAIALGFLLVFAALALLVSQQLFLLLPIVLAFWFILYMPWWRRKVRRRARGGPRWELHPE